MAELTDQQPDIRETVRAKYAAAARAASRPEDASQPGGRCSAVSTVDANGEQLFGSALYEQVGGGAGALEGAVTASLGCGVPTAVTSLHDGEVVLDLGSGAGADVLISARRVAPTGKAIGLDMTGEMLDLARANAAAAAVDNVEFLEGYIEDIPLRDATVDVVISNCVINLSGDKQRVISESARVLRPGGRFAVSDVIADAGMDEATRADVAKWTGCIAGALTREQFIRHLRDAGFRDIEIIDTHRVHEHATAAIIRAVKPPAARCCEPATMTTCCEPGARDACCGTGHADAAPETCACASSASIADARRE
jgi:SAM-dependent methyltransferase